MVINDVQRYRQAMPVRRINEFLQTARASVRILWRERLHAVISPVAPAGELRYRHQFNGCDSQFTHLGQVRDENLKSSFSRVRAHVQFVENSVLQFWPTPGRVRPFEIVQIDHLRWAVNTFGLKARGGIGPLAAILESLKVTGILLHIFDVSREIA